MLRPLAVLVALAAVFMTGSSYVTNIVIVVGLQALPAIGLALLTGYTGQLSLGHAALYGLGAYGAALVGRHFGLPPVADILIIASLVALVGWLIGWIVFRLKGHHLAMATLAFGIIAHIAFVEMRWLTGGPNGMSNIAPFSLLGFTFDNDRSFLWVVWTATLAVMLLCDQLIRSPKGLVMRAIADSERVAGSVGNDVQAMKRLVMALSAFCCAIGGGLYAHYIGYLSPGPFDVGFSVKLLLMVAVGGFANLWGVLFGVLLITVIGEALKPLGAYDVIAFGTLLVVSVIFFPRGILAGLAAMLSGLRAPVAEPRA